MKSTSEDNLVMFPVNKGQHLVRTEHLESDPLEDLLNEFSHIKESDLRTLGLWEEEDEVSTTAFAREGGGPLGRLDLALSRLNDINQRMKYYLNELESHLSRN